MNRYKIFINLSNGIDFLKDRDIFPDSIHFIRIPSSWCEEKKWDRVLFGLSDDFLMHLALGFHCIVLDTSAKNRTPRALWQGLEWIKFVLYRVWFNKDYYPQGRAKGSFDYFLKQYQRLPRHVKRKIKYYKDFLLTDDIKLSYNYRQTDLDGDKIKMKEILKEFFNVSEKH